ncbi:MAG: hypothetical protein ACK55Z_31180 [bacterium]
MAADQPMPAPCRTAGAPSGRSLGGTSRSSPKSAAPYSTRPPSAIAAQA